MTSVATDTVAALRERILDAAERGTKLRIVGRGTWLDANRPVVGADVLSTRELTGITDYVPGDLTLTARAGTTFAEIRDATAAHRQWLALDPYGSDDGTLGATLATASAGPLRTGFGGPRDLSLGVEFVTGAGVIARGGGRVVKNVAGYDLTRLMIGAWGTLGVLTEISVRLHARPEADESFAVDVDPSTGAAQVRTLLRRLPFKPYACEVVNAALAKQLTGAPTAQALFRLGGNAEAVRAQRDALAELGTVREADAEVWSRLRAIEPPNAMVFRLSALPAAMGTTWSEAERIVSGVDDAFMHATPAFGIVRCIVRANDGRSESVTRAFASATSTRIGERLPGYGWSALPSAVADPLSRRVKATFDPYDRLNPGILGGT
jgi:glycolate oxidase FAD binding subunit